MRSNVVPGAAAFRLSSLPGRIRDAGAVMGAGLTGLLCGLVLGYVTAVCASASRLYLLVPWPVESIVAGAGALAVALLGGGTGLAARALVVAAARLIDRGLRRTWSTWRASRRVRPALALPWRLLQAMPIGWLGAFGALLLLANLGDVGVLGLFVPAGALGPYVVLVGAVVALGAAARRLARGSSASITTGRARRVAVAVLVAAAVALAGYGGNVLLEPGDAATRVAPSPAFDGLGAETALEDPGAPGPYRVRTLTYGAGTDRLRPAYGADADLRTQTFDGSAVLRRLGWGADEARAWFWGFDASALPLNGLAWLPDAPGPFPLVLIVHGNHAMGDFSEPGYGYLGEHLASRGFITVSVDENFLNGSWASDWGGSEQLARAWLLLLHLDQWVSWSRDPSSPLHGLVDAERLALIGHSRGGEAASVAASIAGGPPPAPGLTPWPTGLRVRAVVAIAPSDGQYAAGPVVLKEVDFLTLHGGHDADATSWMGIRQYARTVVDDGGFKAAFWSYRANHGQFNTTWGRSDHGDAGGAILDLAPIQDAADQEDVARTAIGAFLEASLHGRVAYRGLFRRPMVGRDWLPADDVYLVRSLDDRLARLTTPDGGSAVDGVGVTLAGFESGVGPSIPLRALMPDQLAHAVELRWIAGADDASGASTGSRRPSPGRRSMRSGCRSRMGRSSEIGRPLPRACPWSSRPRTGSSSRSRSRAGAASRHRSSSAW